MIVVSHRGPISFTRTQAGFAAHRGAGGLVSGLAPLLTGTGATWVAAAMSEDDREAVRAGVALAPGFDLQLLDLDPDLHARHYDVVSNATLWPLLHGLFDPVRRPCFDRRFREDWDAYRAVNEAFAAAVTRTAGAGATVLVHDYQLALVPGALRRDRPDLRVVHFTHTPFCTPDGIRMLPDPVAAELCSSMVSVPSGFHTRHWAGRYTACVREMLGPEMPVATFAAPLGPDPDDLAAVAASAETQAAVGALAERVGDRAVLVRVDRLEPSKNIVRGFAAFDLLLDERPEWRERVTFLALVYPSRQNLAEYGAYQTEVVEAAERVNQRWARGDWQPVILDSRDHYPTSVAALARYDVLLVNTLLDGLNLVAKEGPLLNRRDGVLCLSRTAGAFDELREAAIEVHPYDVLQTAVAIHGGLSMPAAERAARSRRLRELAGARTPKLWLNDLLAQAR
jgi:trehalose 6-phosphate synthase